MRFILLEGAQEVRLLIPLSVFLSAWTQLKRAIADTTTVCLGIHLAKMELRLATARFFRAFPEARVSKKEGMSDDDMAEKIYLLLSPKGKRCLVELW